MGTQTLARISDIGVTWDHNRVLDSSSSSHIQTICKDLYICEVVNHYRFVLKSQISTKSFF